MIRADLVRSDRAQRAAVACGDASLHAVRTRALDDGVEQVPARIEMLVDVHVERKSAALREFEQKIEEAKRLIGILRDPADGVGAGGDRAVEPLPRGIEPARRVGGQMRHHLQGEALAAAFAQPHHCLDAAQSALRFDIGVASDRDRAVCDADVDGALGPRHDVVDGDRRGEVAIAGGGAFQRRARIGDRARACAICRDADGRRPARERRACQPSRSPAYRARDRAIAGASAAMRPSRPMPRSSGSGLIGAGLQHATTGQDEGSFASRLSSHYLRL